MRVVDDEALLLEVADLQEGDRIVSFLTRQHGRRRGAARGARRRYSRFAGQLQPLAKVQVTWFERDDRDLVRVRGVEMVRPATRLGDDLEGILLGCYLAEHAAVFTPENEANDLFFRLLDSTIEALLAGAPQALAARYFEQWALRLAGVFPPPRECALCGSSLEAGALLPRGGDALLCRSCSHGSPGVTLDGEVIHFLMRTHREPLASLVDTPPPPAVLARVEQVCGEMRRGFLQAELKSYTVMQRTLAGVAAGD